MNVMSGDTTMTGKLLLLCDEDNVLVAPGPVSAGNHPVSDGSVLPVQQAVSMGQKVARFAIARGQKILKYGVSIGSATADIAVGEHVHVHNIRSDYTATHFLKETGGGA